MKRFLSSGCFVVAICSAAFAEKWWMDSKWRNWGCVKNNDGSLMLIGIRPKMNGVVTLPRTLRSIPVTKIREDAFRGNALLTDVTIPDNIVSIGDRAFWGCSNLRSLTLQEGVKSVGGSDAFRECRLLKTVTLPKGLEFIRQRAFKYCANIERVNVESVEDFLSIVFGTGSSSPLCNNKACLYTNGVKIVDLKIPRGMTRIGGCTFCASAGMRSIVIPGSVVNIGTWSLNCGESTSIIFENDIGTLHLDPYAAGDGRAKIGPIRVQPKNGRPFVMWVDNKGYEVKEPFHSPKPITVRPSWESKGRYRESERIKVKVDVDVIRERVYRR